MPNNVKLELLETIETQNQLIQQQSKTIFNLVNENVEQESIINEVMRERLD